MENKILYNYKFIWFAFLFLWTTLVTAQHYQTVEKDETTNDAICNDIANTNPQFIARIDGILDQVGLKRNFELIACENINNALAANVALDNGKTARYILYDESFFEKINASARTDWAAISILAHEIGHHLNGHALNDVGSTHRFELEADYFSGSTLAKMGATLVESQSALETIKNEKATTTHPAKANRLLEVARGWSDAIGVTLNITMEKDEVLAAKLFSEGQAAYNNQDYKKAFDYFNQSRLRGGSDAYFYLSHQYHLGLGIPINPQKAFDFALRGNLNQSKISEYQYAKLLSAGIGSRKKEKFANRILNRPEIYTCFYNAYQVNLNPLYASVIGHLYFNGYAGLEKDMEKAVVWYKKAAFKNEPMALLNLGILALNDEKAVIDKKAAISGLEKAADNGLAKAQLNLAVAYANGNLVPKNEQKSYYWYRKAADQDESEAQYRLGYIYMYGITVEKDFTQAKAYLNKASKNNYAKAQYLLAFLYKEDDTPFTDYDKTIEYMSLAAKNGYAEAMATLAYYHIDGSLTGEINPVVAESWLKKAVEQNNTFAQFLLGQAYLYGSAGSVNKKDANKAAYYLEKAAKKGHKIAQYEFSKQLYNGFGIAKDKERAAKIMIASAKQGYEPAIKFLRKKRVKWE